jgi:hypothetical protein
VLKYSRHFYVSWIFKNTVVGIWMFSVKIYWVVLFWHTLNLHVTRVMLPLLLTKYFFVHHC